MSLNPPIFIEIPNSDYATLLSGFGGAVLGALIGAVVSLHLAKKANDLQLKRDADERILQEKASALRAMLKLQEIANGLYTTSKYIADAKETANRLGALPSALFQFVKPAVGLSRPIPTFDSSDFAPFINAKRADVVDRANMLSLRYDANSTTFKEYSAAHVELQKLMSSFMDPNPENEHTQIAIPEHLIGEYKVRSLHLSDMLAQLDKFLAVDLPEAASLCEDISAIAKEYFNDSSFFTLHAHTISNARGTAENADK
ncbi:hypothetical protein J1W56_12270 [Phyllobacterium sp. R2-JL]|nr:hypothetical protein [Phyllobacterium calauticae]